MRIAMVGNTSWYLKRFRAPMMKCLVQRGHEVIAIGPLDQPNSDLEGHVTRAVTVKVDATGMNPVRDLRLRAALRQVYADIAPDVVHHFTLKPIIFGSSAARGLAVKPAIVNTLSGLGMLRSGNRAIIALLRSMCRRALRPPAIAVFENPGDREYAIAKQLVMPSAAHVVVGCGIEIDHWRPVEPEPKDDAVFVFVGRMLWSKGVAEYTAAAELVRRKYPTARFLMVGGSSADFGSRHPDFVPIARLRDMNRAGHVEWLGRLPDEEVFRLMSHARAVVLPSYAEGAPRTLLEAAALGRASIASAIPGCAAVVEDRRTGLLVPPRNIDALAAAMIELVESPQLAAELGRCARARAVAEFDVEVISERYERLYELAVEAKRTGATH